MKPSSQPLRRPSIPQFLLLWALLLNIPIACAQEEVCKEDTASSACSANHLEGTGVAQDSGQGKIPDAVVQQVQQAICDGHQYYSHLQHTDAHRLIAKTCTNQKPLCAYWSVRGQCTAPDFEEFMAQECPLACQLCDAEPLRARAFLDLLYQDLTLAYKKGKKRNVVQDRRRTLATLMKTLDMDPALLTRPLQSEDGNWMETLHQRFMALIPPSMLPIYTEDPTRAETESLALIHGLALATTPSEILPQTAVAYRHRGQIMNILAEPMDHLVIRPLQLGVAFAIPNAAAVEAIRSLDTPILEMGAGSGYWTALLRNQGVQVQAYDLHGISKEHSFYDHWYTPDIQQGACVDVLEENPSLAPTHTLLLIWPNDPDPVDNPQFCAKGSDCAKSSQPVWDAACLRAFLKAGGSQVVFVGERETVLEEKYESRDAGISATREFQQLLADKFVLQETIPIPTMWLNEDDLTIWKRKGVNE